MLRNNKKLNELVQRYTPEWLSELGFERKLKEATPVLIYQMGKVGSSSVYKSLVEQYPGAVVHLHNLSATQSEARVRRLHRWAVSDGNPVNIISAVREPIGRNISAFFENFERDTGTPFAHSNFSQEELQSMFLANYRHNVPLEWFDRHILGNFGIDVYATPFPDSGICTYTRNNVRLLIMRAETTDQEKTRAVNEFLNLPSFRLKNTNIGDEKEYAETYRAFRKQVVLPPEYISRMCDSKYFNHFYSKETVEATRAKWTRAAQPA